MPLTTKGKKIYSSMTAPVSKGGYGAKKGKSVFYASANKGTISGIDARRNRAASTVLNG